MLGTEIKEDAPIKPPEPELPWTDERKALITSWVEKYIKVLHISDYEVNLCFNTKQDTDAGTAATTCANYPYRTGNTIYFYPRWLRYNDRQQEVRVLHELLHIVSDPLYRLLHLALVKEQLVTWRECREANEALVDWLTMVIDDALDHHPTP